MVGRILFFFTLTFIFYTSVYAQDKETKSNRTEKKFKFYGDFRFRAESDRNSRRTDGSYRDDRDRLRYRLRFGFKYNYNEHFELGGRIRSGNPLNQQSPHVTIGDDFRPDEISIDKAYLKYTYSNYWIWGGKNSMPFWRQNEMLWDDDVTPEGISTGGKLHLSNEQFLSYVLGYYIANRSNKKFSDDGNIIIAQLIFEPKIKDHKLTASSGFIFGNHLQNIPIPEGSFFMDYKIWASSIQYKRNHFIFGADLYQNLENYADHPDMDDVYKDQKTGYVGSVKYSIKKFQFGYSYAHIEKYAVIDYFAQDDWIRWGTPTFTRSSNFKGHEFKARYHFNSQFNITFRSWFINGIVTTGNHLESGNRFRLDLNFKF